MYLFFARDIFVKTYLRRGKIDGTTLLRNEVFVQFSKYPLVLVFAKNCTRKVLFLNVLGGNMVSFTEPCVFLVWGADAVE